jgi:ATP synthase mitochondrial F1 complex assembly factor 2
MKQEYGLDIVTTDGIRSIQQTPQTHTVFRQMVQEMDAFMLAAFEKNVLRTKSFIVSLALVHGKVSVQEAADASRVEIMHQIERWGEVEDSHDTDREDLTRQLGSAVLCCMKD